MRLTDRPSARSRALAALAVAGSVSLVGAVTVAGPSAAETAESCVTVPDAPCDPGSTSTTSPETSAPETTTSAPETTTTSAPETTTTLPETTTTLPDRSSTSTPTPTSTVDRAVVVEPAPAAVPVFVPTPAEVVYIRWVDAMQHMNQPIRLCVTVRVRGRAVPRCAVTTFAALLSQAAATERARAAAAAEAERVRRAAPRARRSSHTVAPKLRLILRATTASTPRRVR